MSDIKEELKKHQIFVTSVQEYIKDCKKQGVSDSKILASFDKFIKEHEPQ